MTHDQLAQQAERMRNTLRDLLDEPNHAQAKQVKSNIKRLISDVKAKKSREALDADLKSIVQSLERVDGVVMDHHHSDKLISMCEDMRKDARNL